MNTGDTDRIDHLRREYSRGGLSEDTVPTDPLALFRQWFNQALEARLNEPNAMTLATCAADGSPNARTVLLKAYDNRGFVFFTNYESNKASEIAANPKVALLFPWLDLERQVKIIGRAEKVSTAESLKYFASRPLGSRLGAWVSPQSRALGSRRILEMKLAEIKRKFADGKIPLPDFWGGFRVRAQIYEFWQGRENRLHDRIEYRLESTETESWQIRRLAP